MDFFLINEYRKGGGVKGLSNELMQLRKICQHPFLFDSVEDKMNPTGMIDDKIIRTSGKIELLARILPKFFATDHRVSTSPSHRNLYLHHSRFLSSFK
jgi:SNF2 family DNA or RNA helicase